MRTAVAAATAALLLSGCTGHGSPDPLAGFGPNPSLPAPHTSFLPQFDTPKAVGWPKAAAPNAPAGFAVTRFGEGLDHPRWAYVLPNGDVLVAESASEAPSPEDHTLHGIEALAAKFVLKRVGAQEQSPNKIILLRDADGDGVAETKTLFASGLTRPFGMALVGDTLYVVNDNGVVKYAYRPGATRVDGPGEKVFDLPGGPINHHWTKNILASPDGTTLYATVGSNSNIGDNGMAAEAGRAAIWRFDLATGRGRVFASGLRNPNGLDFEPVTGALWTAVNERDEIGPDVPPDYMTSVRDGGFYGWPYSYWGRHVDARVKPQRPDLVAQALTPDYALGAHTASLGLAFYKADLFPARYRGGAFVGQHGSWNRKPLNGYRVVFVPFANGRPQVPAQVFLTGFLNSQGQIQGRPVGVAVDGRGGLLVVDDVGGIVWRVAPKA
jgi:glucose/arabinose dehydrogenase